MPQKMNRSRLQDYIPKGNGDPSGEYADDNGGNIHIQFKHFQKPSKQDIDIKPSEEPKPSKEEASKEQNKQIEEPKIKPSKQKTYEVLNKHLSDYYNTEWWQEVSKDEYEVRKKEDGEKYVRIGEINSLSDEDSKKIIDYEKNKVLNFSNIRDIEKWSDIAYDDIENILKKGGFTEEEIDRNRLASKFVNDQELLEKMKKVSKEAANKFIETKFPKFKERPTFEEIFKCNPNYVGDFRDPNFWKNYNYSVNCQRCPFVFELRSRGYNVEAHENNAKVYDFGKYKRWESQMDFKDKYTFENKGGSKKIIKQIEEKILNAGNGSRFAINVIWKGARMGHVFTAINDNGNVRFIDTQTGNMDCREYFRDASPSRETKIYRMDNANFMAGVCETTTIGE